MPMVGMAWMVGAIAGSPILSATAVLGGTTAFSFVILISSLSLRRSGDTLRRSTSSPRSRERDRSWDLLEF